MNSSQGIGSPVDPATSPSEGSAQIPEGSTTRSQVSRRRVVAGIAWAAPAAVVATPALAVQASMCPDGEIAPDIGFGAVSTTGMNAATATTTWEGDPFSPEVTVELVHADGETRIPAFDLVTRTGGNPGWERENDPVESPPFSVPSEGPWTPEIRIYFPNALNVSANDIYLRNIALNPVVA